MARALSVAADLGAHYGGEVHLVGVTGTGPSDLARSPEEFAEKLAAFAAESGTATGAKMVPHTETSHDPAVDLDDTLQAAAEKMGADLIVMASHVPGFADRVFASNAGYLASHSNLSVMVVR